MKTALIIGVSGNFGQEMGLALKTAGWQVKALMRDAAKAPQWLDKTDIVEGNAREMQSVSDASRDVDLLVYAANPQYHRWHEDAMAMLEPTVKVAEQRKLRLVFPGNVYNFAPQTSGIQEKTSMNPPTDKGVIRQQMEARLERASRQGARVLIVRAGDFIGPSMQMSWLDQLISVGKGGASMKIPHDEQHRHFWTYLPDLCANTVRLIDRTDGPFDVFHDPGLALSQSDWQQAFRDVGVDLKLKSFPWWLFKVIGLFSPIIREILKMRYLWETQVVLDGSKMQAVLKDEFQATSLSEIIETVVLMPAEKSALAAVSS